MTSRVEALPHRIVRERFQRRRCRGHRPACLSASVPGGGGPKPGKNQEREAQQARADAVGEKISSEGEPLYIVLRRHWGTIGLATASSVSITVYVLLLGFLQRRRFEREAAKHGTTLHGGPGMLNAALRLAAAAGIATCIGFAVRAALLQSLPGTDLEAIFVRAAVLCAVGYATAILSLIFGIRELATFERMLLRRLKLRRPTLRHVSDAPPTE